MRIITVSRYTVYVDDPEKTQNHIETIVTDYPVQRIVWQMNECLSDQVEEGKEEGSSEVLHCWWHFMNISPEFECSLWDIGQMDSEHLSMSVWLRGFQETYAGFYKGFDPEGDLYE